MILALLVGALLQPLISTVSAATLNVLFTGSSGGAVISNPSGLACVANPCSHDFPAGTVVTLYAVPESATTFTGWGGSCSGAGTCQLTINGPTSVTAGFDLVPPVQVAGPVPAYFSTVQAALDAAPTQSQVKIISGTRGEQVVLSRNVSLNLTGGYDATFASSGGTTTLGGPLRVRAGRMTVNHIALARDTSAPTVVLTTPVDNAKGMPANLSCTAVFSKPVAAASVTGTTFSLRKADGSPVAAALGVNDRVAILTPRVPLTPGATYTASLTTGITDLAGNPLEQAVNWSFTIAPAITTGILAQAQQPTNLVQHGGMLFWTETGDATIMTVPVSGGPPLPLAWDFGIPDAIALYGQDIYWLSQEGQINRTPLDGSSTEKLAITNPRSTGDPTDLIVDVEGVYWVSGDSYYNRMIMSMPRSGGSATTLYTTTYLDIYGIAKDETSIYWVEYVGGTPPGEPQYVIKKIPITGGTATILYPSVQRLMHGSIAISGNDLIFAESGLNSYRVLKVPTSGGKATELASITTVPYMDIVTRIVADDTHAYWLDGNSLRRAPLAGGSATILAAGLTYPQDLAVDAHRIYWTESTGPASNETGTLQSVTKTGGDRMLHYQGGDAPRRLLVNAAAIVWTEGGPIGGIEGFGRLATLPLAGGPVKTLFQSAKGLLAVDENSVYVASSMRIKKIPRSGGQPEILASADFYIKGIATDGKNVFWTEDLLGTLGKASVNSGPATKIMCAVTGKAGPVRIANGAAYWMVNNDSICSTPVNGGEVTVAATGLPFMSDFVVDGSFIYFTAPDLGQLMKMTITGGTPISIAGIQFGSHPKMATDGLNVYWIDQLYLHKVSVNGDVSQYFFAGDINGSPFEPDSIAIDGSSVYWTEQGNSLIRKATPK